MRAHALELGYESTVVSLGSCSKIMGPGLRLGWVEADRGLIAALMKNGVLNSGGAANALSDTLVAVALGNGDVDAHLAALNANLKARSTALANSINSNVPAEHGKVCAPADGGYFIWVQLPQDLDAAVVLATAKTLGPSAAVAFLPGAKCALPEEMARSATCLRVSFAFLEMDELVDAGARLGKAITACLLK